MATGLKNVGTAFGGPAPSNTFQSTPVDDDDDVVFIEPVQIAHNTVSVEQRNVGFSSSKNEFHRNDSKSHTSNKDLDSFKGAISETIIIDDEEDVVVSHVPEKHASSFSDRRTMDSSRPVNLDFPSSSNFSRNHVNTGMTSAGITTEPDSEIQIANVTTLDSGITSVNDGQVQNAEVRDMNLMITHVTSLQNPGLGELPNGMQSSNFGVNVQTYPSPHASQSKNSMGPYNPGRINVGGDVFQNGESATHHNPDSWISQSASFPRNQKQTGVDALSPVASLPKQVIQPPQQQQPSKAVKVTCANCKKPLQKGQTAYQRKGSTHLFCSTVCLSTFSHKPSPKKLCTMCKKDITMMKGTIVAQVDSSESFQEFCSTYCLSVYEDKQNASKNQNKSRCTICGKLTEIRHEVSFKNMTHKLCSDHCFNRYRMANGLVMNCCEHCGEYLPSKGAGNNILMVDGQWKKFCSPACLSDFKMKNSKLTSCTGCKTQCRSFDMTQCIGSNGHVEPYCSIACMNNHKAAYAKPPTQNAGIICHFCKRNSLPQYQATMPDGKLYNFCSSGCVAKFQALSMQTTTNGQHASSDIQLKCNYCKNVFSCKPETLDWENKVYQFCSRNCCDDYKKLHCIVTYCEYCQEEKTLHDTMKFSGVKKPFCSEGCKLLYKQDFARNLGLKCVTCNYCFQMCKRGAFKEYDGILRDFCGEECSKKFQEWYYKAARCDCCKTQGTLKEKVQWRGAIKNFCDQQCLLRFYNQQNEPNLGTQKGPENMHYDQGSQTARPRIQGASLSASSAMSKDMKNKAVLCKPLSMTKATYCKPHMQTKTSQTEEDVNTKYVPVPIPVPVYVPVPVHLYSRNVPAPTVIPLPIPVPIFLPGSLKDAENITKQLEEVISKSSLQTFETDMVIATEPVKEEKAEEQEIDLAKGDRIEERAEEEDQIDERAEEENWIKERAEEEDRFRERAEEEDLVKERAEEAVCIEERAEEEDRVEEKAVEEDQVEERAVEVDPVVERAVEEDPVVERVVEEDTVEEKAVEEDPVEEIAVEEDPVEERVVEEDPIEDRPEEEDPIEERAEEEDLIEERAAEEDLIEERAAEEDLIEERAAEEDLIEERAAEEDLIEERAADEDLIEERAEEEDCCSSEFQTALPDLPYDPALDLECDFPRAAEEFDTENDFLLPPVFGEEYEEQPKPRCFKKGKKRKAISDYQTSDNSSEHSECGFPFKYSYGINAWKHWLNTRNTSSDELSSKEPSFTKSVKLKEELLQPSPDELSCLLTSFVNEIRRPNGEVYAPDSIYYLCFGIQEFLSRSKRKDNIFFDPDYHAFGEELNKIIRTWQPSILPDGSIFSRVQEEYLWQLNQLGTQSPMSLLFTLIYFNTKYFNLKTVEQHLRLSFGSVFRQRKNNPLTNESKACLQYQVSSISENNSEDKIAPGKRKHEDEEPVFEQLENTADPSRCPVNVFEYYLSKSPQNLNQRMDVFYLKPESSALTDSTIWYTSSSLDRNTLENMLIRVLLVKDIYDKKSYELDEDTD